MHQKKYALEVLKRYKMEECNLAKSPVEFELKLSVGLDEKPMDATLFKQMVGSLRYLCHSRPDIAYGVGLVNRYMNDPRTSHMATAKRILRYVKGTLDYGLLFSKANHNQGIRLIGFSDADWSGDVEDNKSTTGYVFKLLDQQSVGVLRSKKMLDFQLVSQSTWLLPQQLVNQPGWSPSLQN